MKLIPVCNWCRVVNTLEASLIHIALLRVISIPQRIQTKSVIYKKDFLFYHNSLQSLQLTSTVVSRGCKLLVVANIFLKLMLMLRDFLVKLFQRPLSRIRLNTLRTNLNIFDCTSTRQMPLIVNE